jgi:hypothetical protein
MFLDSLELLPSPADISKLTRVFTNEIQLIFWDPSLNHNVIWILQVVSLGVGHNRELNYIPGQEYSQFETPLVSQ